MAKRKLMAMAIRMRKKEMSYSQIRKEINVSKGTLSRWLRDMPLSKKRVSELRDKNEKRIERYRETMKKKREDRMDRKIKIQKKKLLPISKRDMLIAGFFWYWGEGGKTTRSSVVVCNTDPAASRFGLSWMLNSLKIPIEKVKVRLHLYRDMNIGSEMQYWSDLLCIPEKQFQKTQLKKTNFRSINHGNYGHGTCELIVHDTDLKEDVLAGLTVLRRYFCDLRV